jgi:predicted short-subunit dehydrogenase-like oxidoreductase (DUF2520 family)
MSSPKSLVPQRFSLVGPGRVGTSLTHWLIESGAEIVAIAGRSTDRARALADRLGASAVTVEQLTSPDQDLLLLAVSDPALPGVAEALASRPQAAVVLHTAGALDASVLTPLRSTTTKIGSMHPLMAFPKVLTDPRQATGAIFAIDGDQEAMVLARSLTLSWGGQAVEVPAQARPLYHLAASLAAGGIVTLLAAASEMASKQGLAPEIMHGYLNLARGALERASDASDISAAITGPLARGDLETFRREVEVLEGLDPDLAKAVLSLADLTLRFRPRQGQTAELSRFRGEPSGH